MMRVFFLVAFIALFSPLHAQTPSPSALPSLEQRVADLEAYINNSARGADTGSPVISNVAGPGPGHNAWMMTCAALVLFMTLPGLALFYGGLVRAKNVLSVLAQCLGIAGLVTILWWAAGYSLVFSRGCPFLGGLKFAFFRGVDAHPNGDYSYWVSQNVFAMYQLMFAIITPALIIGAVAERMKFAAVLVLCILLGHRIGFRKEVMAPHSMVLCMVGTGLLWVGWYGFNAGSALAPDGIAANAFMTTTLATAVASFAWAMAEYALKGKPSILGFCSGAVAGLVVITPACGFVDSTGSILIGIAAGLIPFFFVVKVKAWFGYDDALDTFGIHAVGGTLGAFLTGVFATASVNSNLTK